MKIGQFGDRLVEIGDKGSRVCVCGGGGVGGGGERG